MSVIDDTRVDASTPDFIPYQPPQSAPDFIPYTPEKVSSYVGDIHGPESWSVDASQYLNKPYVWGGAPGAKTGTDCSGLACAYYGKQGIQLPRTARDQWSSTQGQRIPPDVTQLQPGDQLFYSGTQKKLAPDQASHTAVYLGQGKVLQESSSKGKSVVSWLNDMPKQFLGAKRYPLQGSPAPTGPLLANPTPQATSSLNAYNESISQMQQKQAQIDSARSNIQRQQSALATQSKALETELGSLDRTNQIAVGAYNAKLQEYRNQANSVAASVKAFNQQVGDANKFVAHVNRARDNYNALQTKYTPDISAAQAYQSAANPAAQPAPQPIIQPAKPAQVAGIKGAAPLDTTQIALKSGEDPSEAFVRATATGDTALLRSIIPKMIAAQEKKTESRTLLGSHYLGQLAEEIGSSPGNLIGGLTSQNPGQMLGAPTTPFEKVWQQELSKLPVDKRIMLFSAASQAIPGGAWHPDTTLRNIQQSKQTPLGQFSLGLQNLIQGIATDPAQIALMAGGPLSTIGKGATTTSKALATGEQLANASRMTAAGNLARRSLALGTTAGFTAFGTQGAVEGFQSDMPYAAIPGALLAAFGGYHAFKGLKAIPSDINAYRAASEFANVYKPGEARPINPAYMFKSVVNDIQKIAHPDVTEGLAKDQRDALAEVSQQAGLFRDMDNISDPDAARLSLWHLKKQALDMKANPEKASAYLQGLREIKAKQDLINQQQAQEAMARAAEAKSATAKASQQPPVPEPVVTPPGSEVTPSTAASPAAETAPAQGTGTPPEAQSPPVDYAALRAQSLANMPAGLREPQGGSNAVQEQSPAGQVPRPAGTGENLTQSGQGVRPGNKGQVQVPTQKGQAQETQVTPEAKLPSHLTGAKPRYNYGTKSFVLDFADDVDKAAYISAQTKLSKADAQFVEFAKQATGMTEAEIRTHGANVRTAIKGMAAEAEGGTNAKPKLLRVETQRAQQTPDFIPANPEPQTPSTPLTPEQRGRAALLRRGPTQPRLIEPPARTEGYLGPAGRGAMAEARAGNAALNAHRFDAVWDGDKGYNITDKRNGDVLLHVPNMLANTAAEIADDLSQKHIANRPGELDKAIAKYKGEYVVTPKATEKTLTTEDVKKATIEDTSGVLRSLPVGSNVEVGADVWNKGHDQYLPWSTQDGAPIASSSLATKIHSPTIKPRSPAVVVGSQVGEAVRAPVTELTPYQPKIGDLVEYRGQTWEVGFAQGSRVRLQDPDTHERMDGWALNSEITPTARTPEKSGASKLIDAVYRKLQAGEKLGNVTELNKMAEEAFGSSRVSGEWSPKDAFDAMEAGINKHLIKRGADLMDMDGIQGLEELRDLMSRITSQGTRTEEQIKNQQFSTPPTEAYVAAKVSGVRPTDTVLEPSAGNGGLAAWSKSIGAKTYVNEIAPRRQQMLRDAGFDEPTSHDGELINALLDPSIKPTVVLMNPPFSASTQKSHEAKNTNKYGFNHVEQALQRLEDNGRLVAILGGGQANEPNGGTSLTGGQSGEWFKKIGLRYNVRANVRIDGKEYQKYGTNFATRIIVIDKDGPTDWDQIVQGNFATLEEAYNALRDVEQTRPAQIPGNVHAPGVREDQSAGGVAPTTGTGESGGGIRAGSGAGPRGEVQSSNRPVGPAGEHGGSRPGVDNQPVPRDEPGLQPSGRNPQEQTPQGVRVRGENGNDERQTPVTSEDGVSLESSNRKTEAEKEDTSAYVEYKPSIKGVAHPANIVETKTMSTVPLPPITYKPTLSKDVISEGRLSDVQLEAVALAGQQNEILLPGGYRASALVGDGTGVGKGRIAAGVLWDNWNKGRKRLVFVTQSWDLMDDLKRDLTGLGATELVKTLKKFSSVAPNTQIKHEGILFTTYGTLRSGDKKGNSRASQLQEWIRGNDESDGAYIAYDESHNLKNAVPKRGTDASLTGTAVKKLMTDNPGLRSVSLSATAATDVMNLGYLDRLGLWGPGTPFPNGFQEFAAQISDGGMSAMEMIARELKGQGKYIARTLSYKGVTYSEIEHKITEDQKELYRSATKAWRAINQRVEQTIEETTGGGKLQRNNFMSLFYSAQQRFFNVLLTTLKIPTAVEKANEALAAGKSVVITLVNTNEAAQNREKAKFRGQGEEDSEEIPDYDFGPGEMLMDLVREHYPTQQWMDDVDENGKDVKRPVIDKDGHPVHNPQAIRERDELLAELKKNLNMPANPLDILIDALGGHKNVAELTGRKERYDPGTGHFISRGDPGVAKDAINKTEERAFQAGKKRIAVLSSAAGTGISLHASNQAANQQQRYHITLQVGWSADKAMQMLGRTHRADQAVPPEYALLKSDLGGETRFISTIARRLGSLEALGKGQTNTNEATEMMSKVNFETDQGKMAANAFYNRLLADHPIPGTKIRGMDVLEDMGVLKEDKETGRKTVPKNDRENVTRLLNRVLSLDPDEQNAVYDYYFDIFSSAVKQAVEDGTLDTGVKTLPGDSFSIKSEEPIATDEKTGAQTFYYPVDAEVRTDRVSPETLLKKMKAQKDANPRIMRNEKGKLFLIADASPIVHANGQTIPAVYMATPENGNWRKIELHRTDRYTEVGEHADQEIKDLKAKIEREKSTLKNNNEAEARYGKGTIQEDYYVETRNTLQTRIADFEKQLEEARANVPDTSTFEKAASLPAWKEQYEAASPTKTSEHHLIGGSVLKYWNPLREASGGQNARLNIYTAVDSKTGKRVVGIDIPPESIGGLLERITGNKGLISANQIVDDVLKNNMSYQLERGVRVKLGRVAGRKVVEFIPPNPDIATNLKRLGILYEKGVMPIYYLPERTYSNSEQVDEIMDSVIAEYPPTDTQSGTRLSRTTPTGVPIPDDNAHPQKMVAKVAQDGHIYVTLAGRRALARMVGTEYFAGVAPMQRNIDQFKASLVDTINDDSGSGVKNVRPGWKVEASQLLQAIKLAEKRSPGGGVTISVAEPGATLTSLKQTKREEILHQLTRREGVNIPAQEVLTHPLAKHARQALLHRGYSDDPETLVDEMFAKLASGKHLDLDLKEDKGAELLAHLIEEGIKAHGDAFENVIRKATARTREIYRETAKTQNRTGAAAEGNGTAQQPAGTVRAGPSVGTGGGESTRLRESLPGGGQGRGEESVPSAVRGGGVRLSRSEPTDEERQWLENHAKSVYADHPDKPDFAREMKADLGDWVEPHIQSLYESVSGKESGVNATEPTEIPETPGKGAGKPTKPAGDYATGARKSVTEPEREARGLAPVEMQLYKKYGPAYLEGKDAVLDAKIDPRKLAFEISDTPRVMEPKEVGALVYDRMRLNNHLDEAYRAGDEAIDKGDKKATWSAQNTVMDILSNLDINDQALKRGGREASAALQAFKQVVKDDYTLGTLLQQRKVKEGRPLTTSEQDEVRKLREEYLAKSKAYEDRIKEQQVQIEAKNARIAELEKQKTARRVDREIILAGNAKTRTKSRAALANEWTLLKRQLGAIKVKTGGPESGALEIPDVFDPAVRNILLKMAKNRIANGINEAGALLNAVHEAVSEILPDVSKDDVRDAMSGHGIVKEPTKDEIQKTLSQAQRAWNLIAQIEEAYAKQKPLRRGFKPAPDDPAVLALRAQLHTVLREMGLNEPWSMTPAQREKSKETRLEARILDYQRRIDEMDFSHPQPRTPATNAKIKDLETKRDELKKAYDALKPDEVKYQQQMKAVKTRLGKQIPKLEQDLKDYEAGTYKAPEKRGKLQYDPEANKLLGERDALKAKLDEMIGRDKPKSLLQQAVALWRAGLLTNPATLVKVFASHDIYLAAEEITRMPAALLDMIVATKTKQRTTYMPNPADVWKAALTAATRGMKESAIILRAGEKGAIEAGMEPIGSRPLDWNSEHQTNNAFFNAYINMVGRAHTATYRSAKLYAAIRARQEINRQFPDLSAEERDLLSAQAADEAVFANKNRLTTMFRAAKGVAGPAAPILDFFVPFPTVPSNLVLRAMEYGFGVPITIARTAARPFANKAFTPEDQKNFVRTFGRGVVGVGLLYLGWKLAHKGQAQGAPKDWKEAEARKKRGLPAGPAIRVAGRWWELSALNPIGTLVGVGAGMGSGAGPGQIIKEATRELPYTHTGEMVADIGEPGGTTRVLGQLAGSLVPAGIAALAAQMDTRERKRKAWYDYINARVPGLRGKLQPKDIRETNKLIDPFNSRPDHGQTPLLPHVAKRAISTGRLVHAHSHH